MTKPIEGVARLAMNYLKCGEAGEKYPAWKK